MANPAEFEQLNGAWRFIVRLLIALTVALIATAFVALVFYVIHLIADALDLTRARFKFPVLALVAPFVGFYYGWKDAPLFYNYFRLAFHYSIWFRAFVFGSLFYALTALVFIEIVHPLKFTRGILTTYGHYWDRNFLSLIKIIFLPIGLYGVGIFFWRKVVPPKTGA